MTRLCAIAVAVQLATCTAVRADVVTHWNELLLKTIAERRTSPPEATRALAMLHAAMYDAVNAVEATHRPLRVHTTAPGGASAEAAAAQAAYRVLVHLYPGERAQWDAALAEGLQPLPDDGKQRGIEVGNLVGRGVISWRTGDGSRRTARYTPGTRPGDWQPTPPHSEPALLPNWAQVVPFAMSHGSQFRGPAPPALDSADYARDFNEVKSLGAAGSTTRTRDQTAIARFWEDGPGTAGPPGHWNRIARRVARQHDNSLAENARLFALLNVALADAAIVCWDMKYTCHLWRPVTAIREAESDGNPNTAADEAWEPLLETPPFPSCSSGHSTFSGAAAEMLSLFFGTDEIAFTDKPDGGQRERSFTSFSQAAAEAGRSRIFGGIHFEFDNQLGLSSGRSLSRFVFDNYLRLLSEQPGAGALARQTLRPDTSQPAGSEPSEAAEPYAPLVTALRPEQTGEQDRGAYDSDGWTQSLRPGETVVYSQPSAALAGPFCAYDALLPMASPSMGSPSMGSTAVYGYRPRGYETYSTYYPPYVPGGMPATTWYGGWPTVGAQPVYRLDPFAW
ncbi:MAG: vanadium-dependent haloperoxidase [Pirellulales bacterium]